MLNDILWPDHIQWQPPTDQTLYRTRPFTELWGVYLEHLRRVWHADRGRLLLQTPGPVPLGLHMFYILYLLRPILFSELVVIFPDYALRISLGTFSILLSRTGWWILMKLGRDKVLMVPHKWCCFSTRSAKGRIQGGAKIGHEGSPPSKNFFFRPEGYSSEPNA